MAGAVQGDCAAAKAAKTSGDSKRGVARFVSIYSRLTERAAARKRNFRFS